MADLLALHKKFPFCWMVRFNRLLGTFWMDALQGTDSTRRDTLRRALRFLRDVYVAVYLMKKGASGDFEQWITQIDENVPTPMKEYETSAARARAASA